MPGSGPQHLLQTVIDVESGDEVQLQEDLARNAQHLQPAVSPRQEVMQGLRR